MHQQDKQLRPLTANALKLPSGQVVSMITQKSFTTEPFKGACEIVNGLASSLNVRCSSDIYNFHSEIPIAPFPSRWQARHHPILEYSVHSHGHVVLFGAFIICHFCQLFRFGKSW